MDEQKYHLTTSEFASLMQVDPRYIQQKGKDVFPEAKLARGLWDISIALPLWRQHVSTGGNGDDTDAEGNVSQEDLRKEKALLIRAQREKLELENALTMGEHLLADDVAAFAQEIQAIYDNRLDALEGRLTGKLISEIGGIDSAPILLVLRPELNAIRMETAQALRAYAERLQQNE